MFRTQANPMDESVVKATDENLTSENWEYILDVCDRVSTSSSGPPNAVSSLIKRLAHRNANVQLYTLELANALSQNCGPPLHRELASKAFTDALLRLANDRNTHAQVKQKVLERMGAWTDMFGKDADLGIMEQAYGRLRTSQPGLMPPSKPGKREISGEDRRKEEEELQMALALSVQDKGGSGSAKVGSPPGQGSAGGDATERDDSEAMPAQAQPGAQQGTTAATVSRVRALYDFAPSEPGELAFKKNDVIAVLESVYKDWWKGSLRGQTGIFPLNYVEKLADPTKEEMEKDAQMEAEVFNEIRNVEKLLSLLSVRDGAGAGRRGAEREEEEIGDLYQRTLSIRPKLIELIGKYSQKKDDFTQLNEKFIKARRDYEALLESSMSQPQFAHPQQQYPIRTPQPGHPMYPPQQQQRQPYGVPPAGMYPPQGPPPAQGGFPPPQPFAASSQSHLPPQQEPQRYYSPAPSEPQSGPPPPQQAGYGSPYPPQDGPPQTAANGASAPFHFIPGGVQNLPPQQQPPQQEPQQHQIRRKPSPGQPLNGAGPGDPYAPQQTPVPSQGGFQGQIRPNSIHTLNSGNPQELATGGYESPIDNRHSYPPLQQQQPPPAVPPGMMAPSQQPQGGYDAYAPQQQQQAPPPQQQPQMYPDRQSQHLESPTSLYSQQTMDAQGGPPYSAGGQLPQHQQQAPPPPQPSGPPPGVPGSPGYTPQQQQGPYQAYQAFPGQQQRMPSGSSAGGDPGDYYR